MSSANTSSLPSIVVQAGGSIQAAVDAATGPTIITVAPGNYKEAILVNKPGIQIIGKEEETNGVIIDNPGEEDNGITVRDGGDGFVLKHVTIQNFAENGVIMIRADNFVLDHVATINNGEYGLFPIRCNNGVISHCSATGHTDSGIYVGQSSNIEIEHCEAYANVSGFEIENCTNVLVSHNKAYDNAAGILVFLLPGLRVKTSTDITLVHNNFSNNNHVNFAPPGSGFEVYIPSGSGILLVGSDNTTISKNIVQNNNFVGIATVSTLVLGALAGIPPDQMANIEPNPDGTRIEQNIVKDNGSAPPPGLPLPAADLLWDGSGTTNCWSNNKYNTSFPVTLPACD
jgi:parallel beta-helix repeat protein